MTFNTNNSSLKHLDFLFWDIVSLIIAFVLGFRIRMGHFAFWETENWSILLVIMIFLDVILTLFLRPYKGIFRRSGYQEIGRSLQLAFYNLIITFSIFYIFHIGTIYSRLVLFYTYTLYFFISVIIKLLWKKHLNVRKHELIPVFLITREKEAESVIRYILAGDFKRFDILGVNLVDSDTLDEIAGIPVITESIDDYILKKDITNVIVNVPSNLIDTSLWQKLVKNGIMINFVIDSISGFHPEESHIGRFGLYTALGVGEFSFTPGQTFYLYVKRVLDIIFGLIGSIFLIPLYGIIKIAYILDGDRENIVYRQTRIGEHGKKIRIYKFRSMVPNADKYLEELLKDEKYRKEWDENQKLEDDPRITKIGKFMRKTSIDELPQLLNVVNGDMSLVGPRPLVQGELEAHDGLKLYHMVKPGITGWWGCNGRSNIDYQERLELEYYYIRNISLYLDVICFIRTIKAIIFRQGAK